MVQTGSKIYYKRIVLRNLASSQIWLNNLRHFGYNTKLTPPKRKENTASNTLSTCRSLLTSFFQGDMATSGTHNFVDPDRQAEQSNKGCVTLWPCHFTLKPILRPKKNYGNSKNISPHKNIIFKKSSQKKNQNSSRYYYNSMTESQVST
jgi:hypothetical protein